MSSQCPADPRSLIRRDRLRSQTHRKACQLPSSPERGLSRHCSEWTERKHKRKAQTKHVGRNLTLNFAHFDTNKHHKIHIRAVMIELVQKSVFSMFSLPPLELFTRAEPKCSLRDSSRNTFMNYKKCKCHRQLVFTYVLEVVLSLLCPANAVQRNVRCSMLPGGSEAGLGNFWESQVLWGRNHIYRGEEWKLIMISIRGTFSSNIELGLFMFTYLILNHIERFDWDQIGLGHEKPKIKFSWPEVWIEVGMSYSTRCCAFCSALQW